MEAQATDVPVVLATVVRARGSVPRHAGAKMLVYADGRFQGTIGGGEMEARVLREAADLLQNPKPRIFTYSLVNPQQGDPGICGGEMEIYLEPYLPPATLFVVGCGHVGQAVADLAHWLGYRVVVSDDRTDLATPEVVPHADVYLPGDIAAALAQHPLTANTFVVLVTRNVVLDRQILPLILQSPAAYIGVMGSKRRWAETRRLLLEDGLDETALGRVHSPIGLELNAETPAEIAVSILAEIMMLRRRGTGKQMAETAVSPQPS
jgi:xanthine dehydrogenase accessory factor